MSLNIHLNSYNSPSVISTQRDTGLGCRC